MNARFFPISTQKNFKEIKRELEELYCKYILEKETPEEEALNLIAKETGFKISVVKYYLGGKMKAILALHKLEQFVQNSGEDGIIEWEAWLTKEGLNPRGVGYRMDP